MSKQKKIEILSFADFRPPLPPLEVTSFVDAPLVQLQYMFMLETNIDIFHPSAFSN